VAEPSAFVLPPSRPEELAIQGFQAHWRIFLYDLSSRVDVLGVEGDIPSASTDATSLVTPRIERLVTGLGGLVSADICALNVIDGYARNLRSL
jgi:hypothetical protein